MTPSGTLSGLTLRGLAREVGLSPTAVSLALRGSPRVSRPKRERIQALAEARGYVPNPHLAELMGAVRRSTRRPHQGTIGIFSLYSDRAPWERFPHLQGVVEGAEDLLRAAGYTIERLWLRQPGVTPSRFRTMVEARGLSGLVCLGGEDPAEPLPAELSDLPIVTFGVSAPGPVHRVCGHFLADAERLYGELRARGYQRPALALTQHGDRRTARLYSSLYLSLWELELGGLPPAIWRCDQWDATEFERWLTQVAPDVLVLHLPAAQVSAITAHLAAAGRRVPEDLGMVLFDGSPEPGRYAMVQQDTVAFGEAVASALVERLQRADLHTHRPESTEMVPGRWVEGSTLRPRRQR